ncbi:MAG: hypothetical protein M1382_03025 [Candidatus Marsarchaeota archaeon]|jgi:hypothetical protein|nr:hypothetical protein [Candidatus Marsarchaeota archaeon]
MERQKAILFAIIIVAELASADITVSEIFSRVVGVQTLAPTMIANTTTQNYYLIQGGMNLGSTVLIVFAVLLFLFYVGKKAFEILMEGSK